MASRDFDRGVRILAGEFRNYTKEKLIVGKGGRRVWINLTVSLVHDDADEPRYFIAVAEDIGKRKQAEEEPQRTQERLRQSEGRFKVLAQEEYEAQRTIGKLTPREKQVLRALGEGLDSKDIAEKLHLIVETERTHMVNILNKLDVHSRLQALVFAARHGLVEMH
jgi:DNA-binding CsgD family transcriptional regulator